jgi:hypothetical protein
MFIDATRSSDCLGPETSKAVSQLCGGEELPVFRKRLGLLSVKSHSHPEV